MTVAPPAMREFLNLKRRHESHFSGRQKEFRISAVLLWAAVQEGVAR
jgi:hypothetical protein